MNALESHIWEIARGFQPSRILLTAVELGVFTQLGDKPESSAVVAARINADPRATDRLMNALVAIGLLMKHEGLFGNTPDAEEYLVEGKPGYMGDALLHTVNMWRSWSTLTEAVKAGTSVYELSPDARASWLDSFIAAMHYNAGNHAKVVVPLVNLDGVERVLDVGGGSGAYAVEFCRRKPGLEAVIFDLPDVLPLTEKYVRESGFSDRISTTAGDYTKDELGSDFDMAFLSAVIHSNSPEVNIELFRKCWLALVPGGRIVVQDFIMNDHRTSPPHGAVFALNMLVGTSAGDTYTETEVKQWLESAKFAEISRTDTGEGTSFIVGQKEANA